MKNYGFYFLGVSILFASGIISSMRAQSVASFGVMGIGPIAPTVAQCPANTANATTPLAALCPVGTAAPYQMYVSYNGGAYAPLVGASGGVTSFNGRSGAVVSAAGDYTAAQVTGSNAVSSVFGRTGAVALQTTDVTPLLSKQACSTSSLNNAGFTASGCTIN
jgi:hypothetical protein